MPLDIAVYMGDSGETASLYEKGKLVVYRKMQQKWSLLGEKDFVLEQGRGLPGMRAGMAELLGFIAGCRVFVGREVAGVPYFELEKAGLSVWEFEGRPGDFLDYVLEKEEEEQREAARQRTAIQTAPVEISGGCYTFSLKEIQEGNAGITSKQALLPFLKKGDFYSLEVVCSHVPPWLEAEFAAGGLAGEVQKTGPNEVRVTITKKCCCYKKGE